jgi:two-component system OmpR family response regulator
MESQPPMTPKAEAARILIVEDHPTIAELVETQLRIEGMRPTKCLGGREALQVLEHGEFDLVILDIMMPDVDGHEVFRFLKSSPRTCGIPVIFLTAKSSPEDVEHGLALGADYYITKPFSGSDLIQKVRNVLARRRPALAA